MFRRFAALLFGVVAVLFITGTTTASDARSIYDAPSVARVDARAFSDATAGETQLVGALERQASPSRPAQGTSTTPFTRNIATEAADAGVLAEDAASGMRPASTPWGKTVQDFQANGDAWSRVSAHAEAASGRIYQGGTSIEEVFTSGDQWLVRHQIYDSAGNLVHETFRPYGKFGAG